MARSWWLADVLADAFRGDPDVTVRARDGWQTRGRNVVDHQGVIDHDTGSRAGSSYGAVLRYVESGSEIAPLYNVMTGHAGGHTYVDVVAAGKANHAGVGQLEWMPDANDGNRLTVGVGHFWTPDTVWPGAYLEHQLRIDVALLAHMGQPWWRRADHKEYAPGRKVDRHGIDTAAYDRRVQAAMEQEDEVTPEDIAAIVDAVDDRLLNQHKWSDYVTGQPYTLAALAAAARSDAHRAARDAAVARRISEQMATGRTLTQEDIDAIADAVADEQAARMAAKQP